MHQVNVGLGVVVGEHQDFDSMTCEEWIGTKQVLRMSVSVSQHIRMKLLQDPVNEELCQFHQIFKLLFLLEFFQFSRRNASVPSFVVVVIH